MTEGKVGRVNSDNAPWFYAGNTPNISATRGSRNCWRCTVPISSLGPRIGRALEIATYKALRQIPNAEFYGRFKNLAAHDDSTLYEKEKPPQHIGTKSLPGDQRLDFMLRTTDAGYLGIECKNVRHWMYPHEVEIKETLRKCIELDAVPVLIARRFPFVTFHVLGKCGLIIHQTYNQILPATDRTLAAKLKTSSCSATTMCARRMNRMRDCSNLLDEPACCRARCS